MNKLKTDNLGGVSFDWDDWRWEQDGVRQAFFGLVSAWGIDPADSFIISGCESTLSGLNYDISAGFVALNGEIYKVDAHSVAVALSAGDTHFWQEIISFDPAGLEATKNAGAVNTYEIRRAVVVNGTIPVPTFMPMVAETIHKKIYDKITPFAQFTTINLENNTDVTQNDGIRGAGNEIALINLPNAGSYLKFQIIGKLVHVAFLIKDIKTTSSLSSPAASFVIKNLPFNFKTGIEQFGSFKGTSNHTGANHDMGEVTMNLNRISFDNFANQGTNTIFNEQYTFSSIPSRNWAATSAGEIVWTLRGNFIAEID